MQMINPKERLPSSFCKLVVLIGGQLFPSIAAFISRLQTDQIADGAQVVVDMKESEIKRESNLIPTITYLIEQVEHHVIRIDRLHKTEPVSVGV